MQRFWKYSLCAIVLLVAGCSRSLTPVLDDASTRADQAALATDVPRAPRLFRARLTFEGPTVTLDRAGRPHLRRYTQYRIYSTDDVGARIDTIPAGSALVRVDWVVARGRGDAGGKQEFVTVDSPVVNDAARGAGGAGGTGFQVGMHRIRMTPPERVGGADAEFEFFVGFRPSMWWAGPELSRWPRSSDGDGRAVDVTDWATLRTSPALPFDGRAWFGPDSFAFVPRERLPLRADRERRTFYEIYHDRIYARAEGDTVHYDSWVVLCNGGFDRDSPYTPRVVAGDPGLPAGWSGNLDAYSLLNAQPPIGSPVAFRHQFAIRHQDDVIVRGAQTSAYPNFDPFSVFRNPQVFGYVRVIDLGKYYVQVVSEDADALRSPATLDFVGLADRVDAGGGSLADRIARRAIVTFHVRQPQR